MVAIERACSHAVLVNAATLAAVDNPLPEWTLCGVHGFGKLNHRGLSLALETAECQHPTLLPIRLNRGIRVPTYQYSCTECGHFFEAVQSFTDDSLTVCPECSGRLRKVFNAVGVVFKGSGFYRTDSRNGAAAKGEATGSSGASAEGGGSTSESTAASAGSSSSTAGAAAASGSSASGSSSSSSGGSSGGSAKGAAAASGSSAA